MFGIKIRNYDNSMRFTTTTNTVIKGSISSRMYVQINYLSGSLISTFKVRKMRVMQSCNSIEVRDVSWAH